MLTPKTTFQKKDQRAKVLLPYVVRFSLGSQTENLYQTNFDLALKIKFLIWQFDKVGSEVEKELKESYDIIIFDPKNKDRSFILDCRYYKNNIPIEKININKKSYYISIRSKKQFLFTHRLNFIFLCESNSKYSQLYLTKNNFNISRIY